MPDTVPGRRCHDGKKTQTRPSLCAEERSVTGLELRPGPARRPDVASGSDGRSDVQA